MEMASKSQKDKSKFCESCDKRFAYNKRLVEHLDKSSGCKEFYISKEITLPVTKAQTRGKFSKDLGEENVENQKNETIDNLSGLNDEPSDIEDNEKVSVWKIYEESKENGSESVAGEPGEKAKRKSYSLEVKLDAIRRVEAGGVESLDVVALDLRLKPSLLRSWWENRDKLAKIKSLKDKKAELNRSKVQAELGESLMEVDQAGGETTLEETSQSVLASAAPATAYNSRSVEKKKKSRKVCGSCSGCEAEDCGECKHCKDKPKFGGKNTIKQRCLARLCLVQEEERKMARGTKGKAKRKSSNSLSVDLSTSGTISEDVETQNVGVVDSSMELNDSSTDVTEDSPAAEKVGGDDLDELRSALGSIGADYSQTWSQEQKSEPLVPRLAAALELIPRTSQANHFPVVSSNHPSISAPEAVVTIERVEKKRKKRKEERSGQPRQTEVHNINNILSQLSPVAPELPSQWNNWPVLPQPFLQQGEGGCLPPQHQTETIYNNQPPVQQFQPNIQQNFYPASSAEAWRSGSAYQHFESLSYNSGAAQSSQTQHPLEAGSCSRVDSVSLSEEQLECLRLVSSKIVKNEMTQTQAAMETGLSVEIIQTWVSSLEDILETNKAALEKANKYDVLVVHYNKMRKAVWNLGKEFLTGSDDDPVDLSL